MEEKISLMARMKTFALESVRVLKITKRPDKQEFLTIVKVSALGMLIIGLIGFLIQLIGFFFFKV